jgi:uncharacterized protein
MKRDHFVTTKIVQRFIVIILLLFTISTTLSAQYDEKFYYPTKGMAHLSDSLNYREIIIPTGTDTLYSVLIRPESGNKTKATIIYYHGNGGNISSYMNQITPLVKAGFQVYIWDYRGYGRSTGTPTHINIAEDSQTIFNLITSDKEVKGDKIIIYGASIGGQPAIKVSAENPEMITGLVLDGSPSSFKDLVIMYTPKEYQKYVQDYPQPYSAKEVIKEIKGMKIVVVHSKEDKVIPVEMGRQLYNNINSSCTKEFWDYNGGHLQAATKSPDLLVEKINALLAK